MIIKREELERFKSLLLDAKNGILPKELIPPAVFAFFTENPHLLMRDTFDEHMRTAWSREVLEAADQLNADDDVFKFPALEFRIPSGRWANLIRIEELPRNTYGCVMFAFLRGDFHQRLAAVSKSFASALAIKTDPEAAERDDEKWDDIMYSAQQEVMAELARDWFMLPLDSLVADLENRVAKPREERAILWTPRIWSPTEQDRQRVLLEASLAPHFKQWTQKGLCFDDLKPSEFEDLVGEVLLQTGLKVYKVREHPQGGRDLIARGVLIPGEEEIEMAVEVKHKSVVDRPEVELALYQNRGYPALLFVTSGRFTAGVFEEKALKENRFRLFLKDGVALSDLATRYFRLHRQQKAALFSE